MSAYDNKYTNPINLIFIIMEYLFEKSTNYNFLFFLTNLKKIIFHITKKSI